MRKRQSRSGPKHPPTVRTTLKAIPHRNEAMKLERRPDGTALATVPMRRPKFLVPPLSWLLPYSDCRRVELDPLGVGVLDLCDGKRTVESIVEKFAAANKLSFREGQLSVVQFLNQLSQRGLVAIVALDEDAEDL